MVVWWYPGCATSAPRLVVRSIVTKSVWIETYGCQMNVADSELMLGVLAREGYAVADRPDDADVMLVNTCAVRDNAEQRVVGRVGELQRYKRPGTVLGVVGCMAQRLGPILLERVPKVDLVVGPDGYRNLPELLSHAAAGGRVAGSTTKTSRRCVNRDRRRS
jgi:tRNA-2-methylthio-N6-dimethylallyladenosine synthase